MFRHETIELNRHREGARFIERCLGELEDELLSSETSDQLAHRVHNVLRTYLRLIDMPMQVSARAVLSQQSVMVLDPDQ